MAALRDNRSYGLSCGRVSDGSKVSVFHVKLTDSALRAFENYRASQVSGAGPVRPSGRGPASRASFPASGPGGAGSGVRGAVCGAPWPAWRRESCFFSALGGDTGGRFGPAEGFELWCLVRGAFVWHLVRGRFVWHLEASGAFPCPPGTELFTSPGEGCGVGTSPAGTLEGWVSGTPLSGCLWGSVPFVCGGSL